MRRSVILLLALACRPMPADNTAQARAAIDAADAQWARLTSTGHADSIAAFYAADAVILPPNMSAVRGRDAIRAFFATMNAMSSPPPTLTLRVDSVWSAGSWAMELGRWNFAWPAAAKRPPGAPAQDSGKYMVRWVQQDGHWMMMQDTWSSDMSMMPAPAAAAPKH